MLRRGRKPDALMARSVSSWHDAELEMKNGKRAKGLPPKSWNLFQVGDFRFRKTISAKVLFLRDAHFLSSKRTVSSITVPTISMLFGLSLSSVSSGV